MHAPESEFELTRHPLVQAHGITMILAWVTFAGLGVIIPRHFKGAWPGLKLGGLLLWFQIHRTCMVLATLLTITGFILIFVELGSYSSISSFYARSHPILGILVTFLTIANAFLSIVRPVPGTPQRALFNVTHFLLGQGAHVLGLFTVYLGLGLHKVMAPMGTGWVLIGFVGWHVLTEAVLILCGLWGTLRGRAGIQKEAEIDMTEGTIGDDPKANPYMGNTNKTVILIVYTIGNLLFAVALMVLIT